jgi:hypothetical protein
MTATPTTPRNSVAAERNHSPSISRARIKERDSSRRDFEVRLLEDETLDDVLTPEFLGHKADVLQPGDRVAVLAFGMSWWAEVLVTDSDAALSSVKTVLLLGPVDLAPRLAAAKPYDLSKVQVEEVAGTWRLRHGSKVLAAGFKSRAEAAQHLQDIANGRKASTPEGHPRRRHVRHPTRVAPLTSYTPTCFR